MREIPFDKTNAQVINLFRKVDKFAELSNDELVAFIEVGKLREYQGGEVIISEGDLDCWVYFLISGSLQIHKNRVPVGKLQRCGDMFGEMGAIDGSPRSASIIAKTKAMILGFDATVIERKLKTNHINFCYIIYRIFAEVLAVRLRETTEKNVRLTGEVVKLKGQLGAKSNIERISKQKRPGDSTMILGKNLKKSFISKRILIVDSTEATRKILRSLLKQFDCKYIIEATHGEHALKILKDETIDLIICEARLSQLSGLELLKKIRTHPTYSELPFIMIAAESDQNIVKQAVLEQVNQCLIKPYNANTLLEKVHAILK